MDDPSNAPLVADSGDPSFTLDEYAIAPEDEHLVEEIINFDPIRDIKGPVTVTGNGGFRLPDQIKATALPPNLRDPIQAQLALVPPDERPAREARLVGEALRLNSMNARITAGEGSDPYQREVLQIARERQDLTREQWRLQSQLAEVARWDNVQDAASGEWKPQAVERLQGDQRKAAEHRIRQIESQLALLQDGGLACERRLQKALQQAVGQRRSAQRQLDEAAEAKKRGEEMAREARINAQAKAHASSLVNVIE